MDNLSEYDHNKHCLYMKQVVLILKKTGVFFFTFILLVTLILPTRMFAVDGDQPAPEISAASAILVDADTGEVLFEANPDNEMLIASTTKVMTALIVLEHCSPEEEVEILPEYAAVEGSSIYLVPGETMTVRDLLYGMLLESGNDAAYALACHTAGSIADFAALMNEKAAELGCSASHFENPHGLDGTDHHSSARDLATIMAAAVQNKLFCDIIGTKSITIGTRTYTNHNKLLWNYEGMLGGKTGYTMSAGRTLVTCAERSGMRLICVTIADPNDWSDHAALYDWAFATCSRVLVSESNTEFEIPVISGESTTVKVIPEQEFSLTTTPEDTVEYQTYLPRFVYAAVNEGETAGKMDILVNGTSAATIQLVYAETVEVDEEIPLTIWEKLKWSWYLANQHDIYQAGTK
jgi:D-alanyl-D-alanine carboxypeptidase (penicillin-binding protein 5/6)